LQAATSSAIKTGLIVDALTKFIIRLSIGPVFRAMLKQKYTVTLLIMQIAITLAVISNALFISIDRYQGLQKSSGIDESNTFVITSSGFAESFDPRSSIQDDLDFIRQLPYVINAVSSYSYPYSDAGRWFDFQTEAGENKSLTRVAEYRLDHHGLETFGLNLIAGENFAPNEVLWLLESDQKWPSPVILTRSVVQSLFATQDWSSVIGKTIFVDINKPLIIKGIVESFQTPWPNSEHTDKSFISPIITPDNSARYVIRVKAGQLQSSMTQIEELLGQRNKERVIRNMKTIASEKSNIYGPDIAAVTILLTVIIVLIVVATLGVSGQASFNVVERQKQIGIRIALGATKANIANHFIVESIIQTTVGVFIGSVMSIGLSLFLVTQYGLPKIQITYLILSIALMYCISIVATLKPALKAFSLSTATTTKR
jgi:putative ABC transport system permease protein